MIFHWHQWKWQTHFALLQEMSHLSLASFCQKKGRVVQIYFSLHITWIFRNLRQLESFRLKQWLVLDVIPCYPLTACAAWSPGLSDAMAINKASWEQNTKWKILLIQLDLGYPAISYPDISIIRPWYCSILSILSLFNYSLAQDKNKVVKYLFCVIV